MILKATFFLASLALGATGMASGQLVINEIMRNPAGVTTERAGEWFELFNANDATVDIDGWTIKDDGSNGHVINSGGPLLIAPGGYLVLGNNGDTSTNGGVDLDYEYDTTRIQLNNAPDELVLLDENSVEVDRVNWDAGETFPNQDGAAMALIDPEVDNNLSYNWCNASTPYGIGDFGTPGAANDCPLPVIVINEIMRNPASVATERTGEWIELFNPSVSTVDINGWTIEDDGTNAHVIDNSGPLLITPGGYLVLGNNGNTSINGGVDVDYVYDSSHIHLNNAEDELVLMNTKSVEIDRVNWDDGATFPNQDGAAMALLNPELDNNISYNWCNASTTYGSGDKGTPGAPNDCPLPKVVINEIMRNPANVATEREGEWFELFNPSVAPVDINGWTIKDDGYNHHVIDNGGPLLIAPGGYLVLGNNDDVGTNGNVVVDYEYSNMHVFLNNDHDELVLLDVFDVEIDRVNWDGGATFPNQDGAAMALIHPSLDKNIGGNWCNASTVYGAGDKGTPGAENDCVSMLVINEIMRNPANVESERDGEWVELFNPTGSDIDINGWTIVDDGFNHHVIDNGSPLVIISGGYLVLGNNADTATNGNVNVDYEYSSMHVFLNNDPDEFVLLDEDLAEIDRVNWDGGATFPNQDGESMSLVSPTLDNNISSNWCGASTVYGDGDKGTPGAENDCTSGRRLADTKGGLRGSR